MKNFMICPLNLLRPILVIVFTLSATVSAQDLWIQDTTITDEAIFAAASITAGPDFTVAVTGEAALYAETVAVKPQLYVISGGELNIITGTPPVSIDETDEMDNPLIPEEFEVSQNYPNPFNPETQIDYALPKAAKVSITIYNLTGQRVRTLVSQNQGSGRYTITWDGTDESGARVSSGIYFYRFTAGTVSLSKSMMLIK